MNMNELKKTDMEFAKNTVIANIQGMQGYIGCFPLDFDELWAMSLDELRELQDKLVKQYDETKQRERIRDE
tara:strand:- start:61 stop:273 length:213 start_codon:yes stop_codon:yes gene_type:complete